MKRLLLAAACFFTAFASFADKITIKNTLGSDLDELGDYDLFSRWTETSVSGSDETTSAFSFGDQFQIDLETKSIQARFRLDTLYTTADSTDDDGNALPALLFVPAGYAHYTPVSQIGFIAGTNFFKHLVIPSAYLAAADTTTKWGRLITDSLGYDKYFTSGSAGVYSNGFAGGITSDWRLFTEHPAYIKAAAGATIYPSDTIEKAVDAGINAGVLNMFDLGFTAHNLTETDRKFGAFAGFTGLEDLVLNLGFYYNFTDSDFLPENRVTRSDDNDADYYEYKKQKTKYALGCSAGYKFENGFGLYADIISGLTNEYIGTIKYYDNDGNLIKTETATIVRGETAVKYKYNSKGVLKAKRTDEFTPETIPFYSQIRMTYDISSTVTSSLTIKLRTLLYDDSGDSTAYTICPKFSFALPEKRGTIAAGLRLESNKARADGITSLSFPLTWTYKFKKKF